MPIRDQAVIITGILGFTVAADLASILFGFSWAGFALTLLGTFIGMSVGVVADIR